MQVSEPLALMNYSKFDQEVNAFLKVITKDYNKLKTM